MKRFAFILFGLGFISTAFTQNTGNITLVKGQKYLVDNKVTSVTTQSLMGQSMESNAELSTNFLIEVKNIKDNNYTLENTFTKMKAKMSAMGNNINFDSDKKEDMDGEYGASFKDMLNKPKEIIIDRSGNILNPKPDETKPSTQADIMKMMVEQLVGDPADNGYGTDLAFVPIPLKFSVGFSWTDSSNADGVQRITTYTVKGIKGNDALVGISGILNTDAKTQMQGIDIVNKSTGNVVGEETVDITTGVIKNKKTILESKGSVSAQGMDIPMTTKVIFTSSVKPV